MRILLSFVLLLSLLGATRLPASAQVAALDAVTGFPLDVAAMIANGEAQVTATPGDIGTPAGVFEGTLFSTANINPAVITLAFTKDVEVSGFRVLFSYSDGNPANRWQVEAANAPADLETKQNSYRVLVPWTDVPKDQPSARQLQQPATTRCLRLTVHKMNGDDFVHIRSWKLLTAKRPSEKPRLVVQTGHSYVVISVAFSPDGRQVLTGSLDNTARLWDTATGKEVRCFEGIVRDFSHRPNNRNLIADGRSLIADGRGLPTEGRGLTAEENFGSELTANLDKNYSLGRNWHRLMGYIDAVTCVAFSSDGRQVLTGYLSNAAQLWDVASGKKLRLFEDSNEIHTLAFSSDGKRVLTGSIDNTARLWNAGTGQKLQSFDGHTAEVTSVTFSPNGGQVLTGSMDHTVRLWDAATGHELRRFEGHSDGVSCVVFSPDGRKVFTGGKDKTARLWDAATGKELRRFEGHDAEVRSVAFSPNGKQILTGSWDKTARLWDASTGRELHRLTHIALVSAVAFSPDGSQLLTGSWDNTARLWDAMTGQELRRFEGHASPVSSATFSADGRQVLTEKLSKTELLSQQLERFKGHTQKISSVAVAADSRQILTGSWDKTARLWDAATAQELRRFEGHDAEVEAVALSVDNKWIATGSWDRTACLWDANTGQELRRFTGHTGAVSAVAISANGKQILTGSWDKTARLWDTTTGQELQRFTGHTGAVISVAFSTNGKQILTGSQDNTARLWDAITGGQLCTLVFFEDGNWLVVDPAGRYDASPEGTKSLHYVVGLTPIDFEQLKDNFKEPGLLAKVLGFNKEPLRPVPSLDGLKLFPEIALTAPKFDDDKLTIELTDQGGGIGPVQVLVNGKRVTADARGILVEGGRVSVAQPQPISSRAPITAEGRDGQQKVRLVVHLDGPAVRYGEENEIVVIARNAAGTLASRAIKISWKAPGLNDTGKSELYAIVSGISDYAAPEKIPSLQFAAKDARDMARALSLGGAHLFGTAGTHITLLTGEKAPQPVAGVTRLDATKDNFEKTFAELKKQVRPNDVLLVYLAGHGTTLGLGSKTYCYLTQNARTGELANSPFLKDYAITSEELIDLVSNTAAKKQVLIFDTCKAGKLADQLNITRDIPGAQKLAFERLHDNTGSYVLMGCTANAVSYEANKFNQGVLTRALLEGMKGQALGADDILDVRRWFTFAQERVPELAGQVGGIQKPMMDTPQGLPFPVASFGAAEREKVPLSLEQPQVVWPRLMNDDEDFADTLGLENLVRVALKEVGRDSEKMGCMVFVDVPASQWPSGYQPIAHYKIKGNEITVNLLLRHDGKAGEMETFPGRTDDLPGLAEQIVKVVRYLIGKAEAKAPLNP